MKPKHALTVTAVKWLAVAAMVCAAAVDARATDRFSGGSFDGYSQSEAQWTMQFSIGSPFNGGSFDGYYAVTLQMAMLLRPPKGNVFTGF